MERCQLSRRVEFAQSLLLNAGGAPLRDAIAWNIVFMAINLYWIVKLIIERRPAHLTPDQERLRQLSFPSLTPREAFILFATSAWNDLEPGASLIIHDRAGDYFSVILRGDGDVIYRSEKISKIGEGQFLGDLDVRADTVGDIDVLIRTATRVMCWSRRHLQSYLKERPDVSLALQRSLDLQLRELLDSTLSKIDTPPRSS